MRDRQLNRQQFLKTSATLAGATLLSSCATRPGWLGGTPTAVDQVPLGQTGLKLSRLGIGVGSNSGEVQRALGVEGFNRLVHHAYDQGVTYIDTAEGYQTHTWVRDAIRGLPREKLFILSKMPGIPDDPLERLDQYRQEIGVDYIDCVLIHCKVEADWIEKHQRLMDALSEARERQIIRAHGVSCHSLPALTAAAASDWVQVNLVRVNPQGAHMDTPRETWNAPSDASHLPPVLEQMRIMRQNNKGIIGMKIIGNGDFTNPDDRERSIRYAMQPGLVDAIVIGVKSPAEIDEAIMRMNRALADYA